MLTKIETISYDLVGIKSIVQMDNDQQQEGITSWSTLLRIGQDMDDSMLQEGSISIRKIFSIHLK